MSKSAGGLIPARVAAELAGRLPAGAYALAPYTSLAAAAVVGWKELGDRRSTGLMHKALTRLIDEVERSWGRVDVVPVPALLSSSIKRGSSPLAEMLADVVNERGWRLRQPLLRRGRIDQVGLGRTTRFDNARASFGLQVAVPAGARPSQLGVVVIDDVITTGATVVTCGQLLASAGWRVHALVAPFARELGD